jgi:hypothetical protein
VPVRPAEAEELSSRPMGWQPRGPRARDAEGGAACAPGTAVMTDGREAVMTEDGHELGELDGHLPL